MAAPTLTALFQIFGPAGAPIWFQKPAAFAENCRSFEQPSPRFPSTTVRPIREKMDAPVPPQPANRPGLAAARKAQLHGKAGPAVVDHSWTTITTLTTFVRRKRL